MAKIELNMAQEIVSTDQDPFFLMLLDLWKAYYILYPVIILQNFEGYGLGPKMWGVLAEFLENQEVVNRQNGYHRSQFRASHVTTMGHRALKNYST